MCHAYVCVRAGTCGELRLTWGIFFHPPHIFRKNLQLNSGLAVFTGLASQLAHRSPMQLKFCHPFKFSSRGWGCLRLALRLHDKCFVHWLLRLLEHQGSGNVPAAPVCGLSLRQRLLLTAYKQGENGYSKSVVCVNLTSVSRKILTLITNWFCINQVIKGAFKKYMGHLPFSEEEGWGVDGGWERGCGGGTGRRGKEETWLGWKCFN